MNYDQETQPLPIGQLLQQTRTAPVHVNDNLHSPLHTFVHETRKLWGETAERGPGSFGYYLKRCEPFTLYQLHELRAWANGLKVRSKPKLFFWKLKELRKLKTKKEV